MAIVENFWLKGQKKKLGGSVIYQAMGQTRQRALATEVSNPRTAAQMNQRVKWANLVNLYRVNQSWMKYAFETKKTNQSEYNKWMSLNVTNSRIFLTKQLAAVGACVVDSYIITQGSLYSIEFIKTQEAWQTNILLDGDTEITANTTVGTFSANILRNNPAIREGDQLSFIRLSQLTNPSTGAPFVVVRKYELIINSTSQILLSTYMPLDYIDSDEGAQSARLVVKDSGAAGGFTMILSRTIGGKTYVSSQSIVVANNDALINYYSSQAALQAAVDSYGESEEAFLTSTAANTAQGQSVINSILDVYLVDRTYTAGTRFIWPQVFADEELIVNMAYPLVGVASTRIEVEYYQQGELKVYNFESSVVDGKPTVASMLDYTNLKGAQVKSIKVLVGDIAYEAGFAFYNEDTIQGLE